MDSLVTNHRSAADCSSNDVYRYLEYLHDVRIVLCIDLIKLFFLNSHLLGRFDTWACDHELKRPMVGMLITRRPSFPIVVEQSLDKSDPSSPGQLQQRVRPLSPSVLGALGRRVRPS